MNHFVILAWLAKNLTFPRSITKYLIYSTPMLPRKWLTCLKIQVMSYLPFPKIGHDFCAFAFPNHFAKLARYNILLTSNMPLIHTSLACSKCFKIKFLASK